MAQNPANRGKSRILDPRANATKGVYEKHLRDKAARDKAANVGSSFYSPGGMKFGTDAYTPAMSTSQYVAGQAQGKANRPGLGNVDWAEVQRRIDAQSGITDKTPSMYASNPQMPKGGTLQFDNMISGAEKQFGPMGGGIPYNPPYPDPPVVTTAPPNPWLEKLASFGAEGDPAAEEARIAFAENLEIIDPLAAAKLREQVALNGIGNVNDPNVFQWNQGVGAAGNQIGLVPAGVDAGVDMGVDMGAGMGGDMGGMGGMPGGDMGGGMGVVGGGSPLDRQLGIVEEALSERETAIQTMLDEGLIDIEAAQTLYDTERERVFNDFLAEQAGVMTGFESEMAASQAERDADRNALNAQLIAAGIDPGLVADEFAMMDATYQGGRDAERDYLDAIGRIGTSADDDRALLGEAVFGGFGQDLRSTAREMDLNAALMAAQERQTARERGLSSELLSPFTGVPEGVMFGGQYAGVDTAGLAEGRLDRASRENIASANLAQELALSDRNFNEMSATEKLKFNIAGIDLDPNSPTYGQYLNPENRFVGLSPFEEFEARQQEQRPLTDLVWLEPGLLEPGSPLANDIQRVIEELAMNGQTLGDQQLLNMLGAGGVSPEAIAALLRSQQQKGYDFFADPNNFSTMEEILGEQPPPTVPQEPKLEFDFGMREHIYDRIGAGMGYATIEEAYIDFEGLNNDPFMGDTGRMTLAEAQAEYDAYTASL